MSEETPRRQIVGYGGKVQDAPRRGWFAQVDDDGELVTDEDGRLIRVRVRYAGA